MKEMVKQKFYLIIKYLIFFVLFYILQKAEVCGLHPFGFGMLFALVWCNQQVMVLAPMYILSAFLCEFSIDSIISSAVCALFFVLVYFLHIKFKKPLKPWLITVYAFLSQFGYLYLNTSNSEQFMLSIVSVILGLIAMIAYLNFMQSILLKGVKRKYTIDELVSAGVLLIAIGAGLASIPDYNQMILRTLCALFVLITCFTLNFSSAFCCSIMISLGISISEIDVSYLALLTIWILITFMLKNPKKIFASLGLLCSDVFMCLFFFSDYNLYYLLSILLAILIFLIIPQKALNKFTSALILGEGSDNIKNIFERNQKLLAQKIFNTGQVFEDMQTALKLLANKKMDKKDAKIFLTDEICRTVCKNCEQCDYCLKVANQSTRNELEKLLEVAFNRGRVTAIDLSSNFMATCSRVNVILNSVNNSTRDFNLATDNQKTMNNTRMIIAEQMAGVGEIFKNIANETENFSVANLNKEQQILETMLYNRITCSDVIIYLKNQNNLVVSCVIKTTDIKQDVICDIVSKILKQKMEIASVDYAEKPLFSVVSLQTVNNFDVVFGSSGTVKNGSVKSGDTHTIIRLDDGKFLMALSDGMGSGIDAEQTSSITLSLIENFYKAGFDNSLILSNANRLLSLKDEESFSALDVCVFDLKKCMCDIIKVGAPAGYIKSESETSIISAQALPLGIIEDINPQVQSFVLKAGDFVVLVTDGVSDAFDNTEELQNFINNAETSNPQVLADLILDKALEKTGNFAEDDMTVLVGKIWEKL